MKRIVLPLLLLALALGGCSAQTPSPQPEPAGLRVVATIFAPFDFARALTSGAQAQVTMLIKPGVESHTFDPSPSDILAIQQADVFLCIGGHDENWVDTVLTGLEDGPGRVVKLIDCVETLANEAGDQAGEGGIDEHIWTSPRNAKLMAKAIADALAAADEANAPIYEENYRDYAAALDQLDGQFRQVVENGARRELVFGDRFPFRYFAKAYGLSYVSAFAGCSGEGEPSAAAIAMLIETIKTDHIPVVYHIEQGSVRTAEAIAQEAGVETLLMHSCHNLTVEEFSSGQTYLTLMQKNVEALKKGLN